MKASTASPLETIKQTIRVDYQRFILVGFSDWPAEGPSNWVSKWEDLILKAAKYSVQIDNWLSDVVHIWKRVPALSTHFYMINTHIVQHRAHEYTVASVASDIVRQWELKKQGDNVKVSKPRTTQSAFTTQEATLGETDKSTAAAEAQPTSEASAEKTNEKLKKKNSGKRKQNGKQASATNTNSTNTTNTNSANAAQSNPPNQPRKSSGNKRAGRKKPQCPACGGYWHTFSRCFLVQGIEKDWLDREIFDSNMKVPSFQKKVNDYRATLKALDEAKEE